MFRMGHAVTAMWSQNGYIITELVNSNGEVTAFIVRDRLNGKAIPKDKEFTSAMPTRVD